MRWAGHLAALMVEKRKEYRILMGKTTKETTRKSKTQMGG
jgi:hypothetical protein